MNVMAQLSEPFPKEVERQLKKSGTSLTYIPVSEVITRLNKVVGVDRWSFRVNKCERDALDPDFIVAHVTLEAYIQTGETHVDFVRRDGIGGQKIKRTKTGEIVDLGDEFKGAVSDALKKAAQTLGIGLYLARTEEALAIDEEESKPAVSEEIIALWTQFMGLSKNLSAEKRAALGAFWTEWSDGAPKPTLETASAEDLDALIAEALRLDLDGKYADE